MCHRLRHTWATNAHRVGLSIFDIQEQGGWKKLDMVRRYTKSRPISELRRMPTSLAGMLKRKVS
jgi:integrase